MNPISDNSDAARYQRGLHAYASQFHITPEQVPGWFADAVGDRLEEPQARPSRAPSKSRRRRRVLGEQLVQ